MTKATYTKPCQVATNDKSATHNWFGCSAVKSRFTRSGGGHVDDRRHFEGSSSCGALKSHLAHQALDRAASHFVLFTMQLPPDLVGTIDPEIVVPDALNLVAPQRIATDPRRQARGVGLSCLLLVVGGRGDR